MRFESQLSRRNCQTFFLRVQLRALCRQGDERDVGREDQPAREMPAGLIGQHNGVRARRDLGGDFGQVQVHRLGVATRHDERRALAVQGADRAEDIGRLGSLICWRARARSTLGPTAGDLVLLADARLVGEPDFYGARIDGLLPPDLLKARGETFLKFSIAPAARA